MVATIMKTEKLVEVKDVGEEQNAVSKSETEAKEGVQKKRGRKVNNANTSTATKCQEKNFKPRDRPKQAFTTKEEMVTRMGVVKSNADGNKSPDETEEGMVDVQIILATPDREGNGTNEAINNKEGAKENGSCIKVALDFVSPKNVGECMRLTKDFRLLPHNHKAKEDKLEVFSNLYEVPITKNLQTSQKTEKDSRLKIDHDMMYSHPEYEVGNEGSGGIIKRSRTSENMSEKKGKGKESSHSCSSLDKFVAELHKIRVTRDNEVEVMKKRLDLDQKREERKTKKMHHKHLNTLLARENLSPEDEDMKRHLLAMLYGQ